MKFPIDICMWCNEENPKENHKLTCAETFKPKQFVPSPKWISVKQEIPEFGKLVLFSDGVYIDCGYRLENDQLYCMGAHITKSMPTHWMHLPELPK